MAHDTAIETENQTAEQHDTWNGGESPFKASYGKLMMWYFLLSDAFTFAGFLIAYGSLRFSMNAWPVPDHVFSTLPFGGENAPLIFVTIMTFILIVSSVTVLRAVQEGHLENTNATVKWLVITVIGGAAFLGCQAWEWNNLIVQEGVTIYNNPFSSHLDEGKYITLVEAKANNPSLMQMEMDVTIHNGDAHTTESLPYLVDKDGNKYFEKVNHHYFHRHGDAVEGKLVGTTDGGKVEKGEGYLIAYSEGEYFPGVYQTAEGVVKTEEMGPKSFGTLFFFITGFHGLHVFSGLVMLIVMAMNTASGFYRSRNNGHEMVEKIGLYWHFVDLVWVFVFLAFYLL